MFKVIVFNQEPSVDETLTQSESPQFTGMVNSTQLITEAGDNELSETDSGPTHQLEVMCDLAVFFFTHVNNILFCIYRQIFTVNIPEPYISYGLKCSNIPVI